MKSRRTLAAAAVTVYDELTASKYNGGVFLSNFCICMWTVNDGINAKSIPSPLTVTTVPPLQRAYKKHK